MTRATAARHMHRLAVVAALVLLDAGVGGCFFKSGPQCGAGMQAYKSACLSQASVTYLTCTENRGFDTSTEIGGGLGGSFKVIANASINAAYKKAQKEDSPVALQIVKDCMTLAKQSGSGAEQSEAQSYARRADEQLRQWEQQQVQQTPHITTSRSTAAPGDTVVVTGRSFVPNETVDIRVHVALVKQVQVDGSGSFSTKIVIPPDVPPPSMQTTITVTGESSSRSASAPFRSE